MMIRRNISSFSQNTRSEVAYGTTDLDLIDFTFESGTSVGNVGAYYDKHMSMKKHVTDMSAALLIITSGKLASFTDLSPETCVPAL